MKVTELPPTDYLNQCFAVVGSILYWKSRPRDHFRTDKEFLCHETKLANKPAGRIMQKGGYVQVLVAGRRLLAHRIVAAMHGLDVSRVIDHIDGNTANNDPRNLRPCSQAQNTRNVSKQKSKDLPVGVYGKPNGKFTAHIRHEGRHKHLGTFASLPEAFAARRKAEDEFYGEFSRAASLAFGAQHGVEFSEIAA